MISLLSGVGAAVVIVVTAVVGIALLSVILRNRPMPAGPVLTLVVLVVSAAYLLKAG